MISFRTHVVTLVAVFLALAVGVVLGGGPLSELGRGSEQDTAALEKKIKNELVNKFFKMYRRLICIVSCEIFKKVIFNTCYCIFIDE